ncbi:HD domain-containing protein [Methanocaldococcus infernus]|uniref:Metal dependent phosphohydrolase n=1 Tax=Methanocaldococcus infernus (strain DSM 11812 / JCM 15783 / ME) TaxID=573063 RepID=D5VSW8_METIM|nr:HD domain-containing protein [Methanocaldococcus infernus]ADG13671.1 metal dependent phosphohydrolase [Methanocaldococcus infernus ME]
MKVIRDSIHKDIYLSETEIKIIDSEEFQRLRNIKQTGLTYLVYPSANHTRFEHSIGTLYVASRMGEKLGVEDLELLRVAALLHDIGHPPFSHTLEILGYDHEQVGKKIIKKMDLINFSPSEVLNILSSRRLERKIINGDVDADRIDYLLRDSYHTGTAYGMIDLPRILRSLTTFKSGDKIKMGILRKGIMAIESLLVARHQMYSAVYLHPTVRIADKMLKKAVIEEYYNKNLDIKELSKMDDPDLISLLRHSENRLMRKLDKRELFKRVLTLNYHELSSLDRWRIINLSEKDVLDIENLLSESFGREIFLDIYPIPTLEEHDVYIVDEEEVYKLDSISPLARTLRSAEICLWNLSFYSEKRDIDVEKLKKEFLSIIREKEFKSNLLEILKEHKKIVGKSKLFELSNLSYKEFNEELKKLIFSSLVKEEAKGKSYVYSVNL